MNSLDIIKQELIKQKQVLDEKGITVSVANTNPTPSEITAAVESINLNLSDSNATVNDVRLGTTFYSQNLELKTGTLDLDSFDALQQKYLTYVIGSPGFEIEIPSGITYIRPYAFYTSYTTGPQNIFTLHNFTVPSHITQIDEFAFYNARMSGTLIVPETCTILGKNCFSLTDFEEAIIYNGLRTSSNFSYNLSNCESLVKLTILQQITQLPPFLTIYSPSLLDITLPASLTKYIYNTFAYCSQIKHIRFTGTTPPTFDSNSFKETKKALLAVPYLNYDTYINTTNFLIYGNTACGWGEFNQGDVLPTGVEGYTLIWYPSWLDATNQTNPITTCEQAGIMYALFTPISTEDTTEDTTGTT